MDLLVKRESRSARFGAKVASCLWRADPSFMNSVTGSVYAELSFMNSVTGSVYAELSFMNSVTGLGYVAKCSNIL